MRRLIERDKNQCTHGARSEKFFVAAKRRSRLERLISYLSYFLICILYCILAVFLFDFTLGKIPRF